MSGQSSSAALLHKQRSHILLVLSDANPDSETAFLNWYQGPYRDAVAKDPDVLRVDHYERHEIDITLGQFEPLPFRYLGLCELSLDGAQAAQSLIERITALHRKESSARSPATWLYYPVSEKVGRSPERLPSALTLAFANGIPGTEGEFEEWYATRHIRHAMSIPDFRSGQCFARTQFQKPGALTPSFSTIAVYETTDAVESIIESAHKLDAEGKLAFPSLDLNRFAESVYRPLSSNS